MSSLFIRLYLDEDINVLVADLLNARGFDVSVYFRYELLPLQLHDIS
jgi:hypothetical protein